MDCSTIIVSYNTFELTLDAVRSALRSGGPLQHEVIVVDNASPDQSARRLREALPESDYPNVHIVASNENLGFSRANNAGARLANGRVLFFLNPDTIVRGDAIPLLVRFLDANPEAGAVGPRILSADGTDQPSVRPFTTVWNMLRYYLPVGSLLRGRARRLDPVLRASGPVDIVRGCALAIRRDTFVAVGGWDESYFMYAEEDELCWNLRQAGYSNYFLREAQVVHFEGGSTLADYTAYQIMERRSALRFLRKRGKASHVIVNRIGGSIGFGVRAVLFRLLAVLRPREAASFRRRGDAAAALWRWFVFSYS